MLRGGVFSICGKEAIKQEMTRDLRSASDEKVCPASVCYQGMLVCWEELGWREEPEVWVDGVGGGGVGQRPFYLR